MTRQFWCWPDRRPAGRPARTRRRSGTPRPPPLPVRVQATHHAAPTPPRLTTGSRLAGVAACAPAHRVFWHMLCSCLSGSGPGPAPAPAEQGATQRAADRDLHVPPPWTGTGNAVDAKTVTQENRGGASRRATRHGGWL